MGRYKGLVKKYNEKYSGLIGANIDTLIEAFTSYYGEEFREKITAKIKDTIISWNVNSIFSDYYENELRQEIFKIRVGFSARILNHLGIIDTTTVSCNGRMGRLYFKNNTLCIDPGKPKNVRHKKDGKELDDILKFLYGKNKVFNFDYDNDLIYNFNRLNEIEKDNLITQLFGENVNYDECVERINSAIQYMDSIRDEKDFELRYEDVLVVVKHLKYSKIYNRIFRHSYNSYGFEFIDFYNNTLDAKKVKKVLKELTKVANVHSFQVSTYDCMSDSVFRVVSLPIAFSSDIGLIHELNHAVVNEVLGNLNNGRILEKLGLYVSDDTKLDKSTRRIELEEILNHASSCEICNKFHELGGMIFGESALIDNNCEYDIFFPLINSFYSTYKDVLKQVRITSNLNKLYKYADEDVFNEYVSFFNSIYDFYDEDDYYDGRAVYNEEQIAHADNLVKKMRTAYFNSEYLSENEDAVLTDFKTLVKK